MAEGRKRRITLKEIAKQAGVSVTTASVALSGKGEQQRISTQVIERVREIAREHDYAPNLLVRSLRGGRSQIIGFYNAFRMRNPNDMYFIRLMDALDIAVEEQGYNLLLFNSRLSSPESVYETLNGGMCDGVIYFGPTEQDGLFDRLSTSRLPSVLLNHKDERGILSSVSDNWEDGMRQVAESLVALGHRRIGAVTSAPGDRTDAPMRVDALRRMLRERGADLPDRYVVPLPAYGPEGAREVVRVFRTMPEPPTAVFCWHDLVGYTVMDACNELGVAIPGEMSLVGYDGVQWALNGGYRLASVHVDLREQAREAVRILDRLAQGESSPPIVEVMPVVLRSGDTLVQAPVR